MNWCLAASVDTLSSVDQISCKIDKLLPSLRPIHMQDSTMHSAAAAFLSAAAAFLSVAAASLLSNSLPFCISCIMHPPYLLAHAQVIFVVEATMLHHCCGAIRKVQGTGYVHQLD